MENKKEQRRLKRVYFSAADGIEGVFSFSLENSESNLITANIMNLSAGGLNAAFKKHAAGDIRIGDRLILKKIRGTKRLEFCTDMELEVRWTMGAGDHMLKHVGVGCEFKNIPESIRQQIAQFVDSETEAKSLRSR